MLYLLVALFGVALSSSSSHNYGSKKVTASLNVATYNVFQFPGEVTNEGRRLVKEEVFHSILSDESIDIICLQEVNPFVTDLQAYIYNDENLSNDYNYIFSFLDAMTPEQAALPRAPCNSEELEALQSDCIINNCVSSFSSDIFEFIFCVALACPEESKVLQRSECGGCLAGFSTQVEDLATIVQLCALPQNFNFIPTGGVALLSKYPLSNSKYTLLPSNFDSPRYLITSDVLINNGEKGDKKRSQKIAVGCLHTVAPTAFSGLGLPFITFDEEVVEAGVTSYEQLLEFQLESVNEIFEAEEHRGKPKLLLGDFNTAPFGDPESALPDSFAVLTDDGWISTVEEETVDFDCSFCGRLVDDVTEDTICTNPSYSDVNPLTDSINEVIIDNILYKDFNKINSGKLVSSKASRFMDSCYSYNVGETEFNTPLSDHYAVKAEFKIKF